MFSSTIISNLVNSLFSGRLPSSLADYSARSKDNWHLPYLLCATYSWSPLTHTRPHLPDHKWQIMARNNWWYCFFKTRHVTPVTLNYYKREFKSGGIHTIVYINGGHKQNSTNTSAFSTTELRGQDISKFISQSKQVCLKRIFCIW